MGGADGLADAVHHLKPRQLLLLQENSCSSYQFWRMSAGHLRPTANTTLAQVGAVVAHTEGYTMLSSHHSNVQAPSAMNGQPYCDAAGPHWLQAKWIDECFLQRNWPFFSDASLVAEDVGGRGRYYLAFDYYVRARPDLYFGEKIPSLGSGIYDTDSVVCMVKSGGCHDAFFAANRRVLATWWLDASTDPQSEQIYFRSSLSNERRMCLHCAPPRRSTSVHSDLSSGMSFGCCPELNLLFLSRWSTAYR